MGLILFNTFSSDRENTECTLSVSAGYTTVGRVAASQSRETSIMSRKGPTKTCCGTSVRTPVKFHTGAELPYISATV